jgi:hypothetical protein
VGIFAPAQTRTSLPAGLAQAYEEFLGTLRLPVVPQTADRCLRAIAEGYTGMSKRQMKLALRGENAIAVNSPAITANG